MSDDFFSSLMGGGAAAGGGAASFGGGAPFAQGAGPVDVSQGFSMAPGMSGGGGGLPGMGNLPSAVSDINKGTAGIASYRQLKAEARATDRILAENQRRAYVIHRAVAGDIRAKTGAQGTTMAGNPMAAEVDALEQARIIANDIKLQRKQAKLAYSQAQNAAIWQGVEGFTGGIVKGSGILQRRT